MPPVKTTEGLRTWPDTVPPENRTLGWSVLAWSADYLTQPDGPNAGTPWEYTREQTRIVLRWYEIDARGRFKNRRGVLRRMKGWGKDPFLASLAAVELCGPCRFDGWDAQNRPVAKPHPAPWVQVAAVSRDQTRNTMTLFPGLFTADCIDTYGVDLGKEIIYARGTGRIEAVTSSPRALEGGRPTLVIANETHHWLSNNEGLEMADVIRRNLAKSRDGAARVMEITNAHLPGENSAAEATYEAWRTGENVEGVYYDSLEAPLLAEDGKVIPLGELDQDSLRNQLLAARGDSEWVDVDRLAAEIGDPVAEESKSRRFYLNQVTKAGSTWLPEGSWDACADPDRVIPDHAQVVLGFDGAKGVTSGDTTCLVVVSVEEKPHVAVLGLWERPKDVVEWRVPRNEVKDAIRAACARWKVLEVAWDEYLWLDTLEDLEDEGVPCVIFPQNMTRMGPSTQRLYEAVQNKAMTHSGDAKLAQHVANATTKTDSRGTRLVKDHKMSPRKIDLCIATVMAFDVAGQIKPQPKAQVINLNAV